MNGGIAAIGGGAVGAALGVTLGSFVLAFGTVFGAAVVVFWGELLVYFGYYT